MKNKVLWGLVILNLITNIILGYFITQPYFLPKSPWEEKVTAIVNTGVETNNKNNQELRDWVKADNQRVLDEVNKKDEDTLKQIQKMLK